jgi:aspartate aminotransferase
MLAQRLRQVQPARTMEMNERAQTLQRQGISIWNLTAGEPDFPTPAPVQEAALQAMRAGHTRYTPSAGIPELRAALAQWETARLGLEVRPNQVIVTSGGKQALYNFFMAFLNPGDEVLIPTPCWVSFYEQVRLADGLPVFVPTSPDHGFFPTVHDLERYRTARTRALVLNTPNNPTGQVLRPEALQAIVSWSVERGIVIVFDECYADLTFPPHRHWHPLQQVPEARPWVVSVNTFSKTFCMTGWRVGWAVGPEAWVAAMTTVQSHSTSHPTSISQWAALAALQLPPDLIQSMRATYERRARWVCDRLAQRPGLRPYRPQGTFYVWVDVRNWLEALGTDDFGLALRLLEEAHVATVPGEAFQMPGYLRLSFATSEAVLENALTALMDFADRHGLP